MGLTCWLSAIALFIWASAIITQIFFFWIEIVLEASRKPTTRSYNFFSNFTSILIDLANHKICKRHWLSFGFCKADFSIWLEIRLRPLVSSWPVQSICVCVCVCVCMSVCVWTHVCLPLIGSHRGHADLGSVWTDDLKVKLYILLLIPSSLQVMIDFFSA